MRPQSQILRKQPRNGEEYEYIDFRDHRSSQGSEEEEIFANRFAAELLMPKEEIRRLVQAREPIWFLAAYFDVSDDAMRIRLKSLGLDEELIREQAS